MSFLLDTSVLIEIENNNLDVISQIEALNHGHRGELCISIFNFTEFYFGAMNKNEKNKEKVKERLSEYQLLNTTQKTGEIFCEILHQLTKTGKLVTQFNVFIAAFALENNLTLISLDNHFQQIPGLKLVLLKL